MRRFPASTADLPPMADGALALLEPRLRDWFVSRYGPPTAAQRHAWPRLIEGQSLLLSAPTGSGKTWAALMPLPSRWLEQCRFSLRCAPFATTSTSA